MKKLLHHNFYGAFRKALEKIYNHQYDKLAKRGIIHKNKAANLKRKLTKGVNTLGATAATAEK